MLAVGLTFWLLVAGDKDNARMPLSKVIKTSDYAMTNFKLTVMDSSGQPARIVYGDRLIHYPSDDSTHVIAQMTELLSKDKTVWVISSDIGDTKGTGEDIVLTGSVAIVGKPDQGLALYTDKLYLNTVLNTAYTDKAVAIKTPDDGQTNGVGMDAKLQDRIFNLHSEVIGYHESPFAN